MIARASHTINEARSGRAQVRERIVEEIEDLAWKAREDPRRLGLTWSREVVEVADDAVFAGAPDGSEEVGVGNSGGGRPVIVVSPAR